jgi:adenylate cyclase
VTSDETFYYSGMYRSLSKPTMSSVKALESAGNFIVAADMAMQLVRAEPENVEARYLAVRCMARGGATRQEQASANHIRALSARIEKDLAFQMEEPGRSSRLRAAAEMYEALVDDKDGFYPAVNAATLYDLAGHHHMAEELARVALDRLEKSTGGPGAVEAELDAYFREACRAEAHLVLGESSAAAQSIELMAQLAKEDLAARAASRKQLRRLLAHQGLDDSILAPLDIPRVAHFTGHMAGSRYTIDEEILAAQIAERIEASRIGFLYGSLACGSDIIIAETARRLGREVHAVLPFRAEDFVEQSVRPGGENWVERFRACLAQATSITYASDDALADDEGVFAYASRLAMGLALVRSESIDAEALQIAVWDGEPALQEAGTSYDVETWRSMGRVSDIIHLHRNTSEGDGQVPPSGTAALPSRSTNLLPEEAEFPERRTCALLFGDVPHFSRLSEASLPRFYSQFIGAVGAVIDRHRRSILYRNTWGDAMCLVLTTASVAARCALDIQEQLSALDFKLPELPEPLGMRMRLHFGPVFVGTDRIRGQTDYFGRHVTRAARIESITPVGEVYATSAVAAELAMERNCDVAAEYVGQVPTAKNFGMLGMYHIRSAVERAA